jgi:hypothetical protein
MQDNRRANWLLGVGVAVGVMAGLAIGRKNRMRCMPHLDAWQQALAEQWGKVGAAMLASRVLAKYKVLYARRPRFTQRVLQSHLERDILPGLALYQVLLEETGAQEDALVEVGDLLEVPSTKSHSMASLSEGSSELDRFYLDVLAAYGAPELALLVFSSGEGE